MTKRRWEGSECGSPAVYALERLVQAHPGDDDLLNEVNYIDEYMTERFEDYETRLKEAHNEANTTLRDRCAVAVRAAVETIEEASFGPGDYHAGAAKFAYEAADAMLEERAK